MEQATFVVWMHPLSNITINAIPTLFAIFRAFKPPVKYWRRRYQLTIHHCQRAGNDPRRRSLKHPKLRRKTRIHSSESLWPVEERTRTHSSESLWIDVIESNKRRPNACVQRTKEKQFPGLPRTTKTKPKPIRIVWEFYTNSYRERRKPNVSLRRGPFERGSTPRIEWEPNARPREKSEEEKTGSPTSLFLRSKLSKLRTKARAAFLVPTDGFAAALPCANDWIVPMDKMFFFRPSIVWQLVRGTPAVSILRTELLSHQREISTLIFQPGEPKTRNVGTDALVWKSSFTIEL